MNQIIFWKIPQDNIKQSALDIRKSISLQYEKRLLTDDKYFKLAMHDYAIDAIIQAEKILSKKLSGVILEVGAGNGIHTCYFANRPAVEKVFALDYSEESISELMSFVINKYPIPEKNKKKIFPVIGSFNNISLPDNSVDFVINVLSLHHSEDREKTFNEIYRVLKIGGFLISVDRASYNTLSNIDLNNKLDIEFSDDFKKQRGLKIEENYTRRMNSEHDPLLSEWEYLLCKAGFKVTAFWIYKPYRPKFLALLYKLFIGSLFYIIGPRLMKKKIAQIGHAKIPFYPFFSKKSPRNLLLVAEKIKYSKMP